MRRHAVLILAVSLSLAAQSPSPTVEVSARPSAPVIELTSAGQDIGTDLVIVNQTADTLELARIQVTVRNRLGELVLQKEVGQNGGTIRSVRFDLWFDAGGRRREAHRLRRDLAAPRRRGDHADASPGRADPQSR